MKCRHYCERMGGLCRLTALVVCFCLVAVTLLSSLQITPAFAENYSLSWSDEEKLSYLSSKFKNGWYWNHWTNSEIAQYGITQESFTIGDFNTTISTKACPKHNEAGCYTGTAHTCNKCKGSYQCIGYARLLYNLFWGKDSADGNQLTYKQKKDSFLDYAEVGDYLYFDYSLKSQHAVFITGVDHAKGTITFTDCNWNDRGTKNCVIRWNVTVSKETIYSYIRKSGGKNGWIRSVNPIPSTPYTATLQAKKGYVTMSVGDTYFPLYSFTGGVGSLSVTVVAGNGNVICVGEDDGAPTITGINEGYALLRVSDQNGQTADLAITVLPHSEYMAIYPEDEDYGTTITADYDRTFLLQCTGPGNGQTISKPVWTSSDPSILKVVSQSDNGFYCTVRAMSNGTAKLNVSFTADMGNPYFEYNETWSEEKEFTAIVPASGNLNCVVPAGSVLQKLDYLRQIFPDGWYFNSWPDSKLGGTDIQYRILVNGIAMEKDSDERNKLGVSNKPCNNHSYCSHYWGSWGGSQGLGYVRMMMYLLHGVDMETSAYMVPYDPASDSFDFLLTAQPGDVIGAGNNRYYVVQAVNGDQFTVTDCNNDGDCAIRWDAVYTLDDFRNQILNYPHPKSGVYIGRVYKPVYQPMPAGEVVRYEVISDNGLEMRSQPYSADNSSVSWGFAPKGSVIFADRKYVYSRDAGWSLCRTEDGSFYGWAQVDDTTLCRRLEDNWELIEHDTISLPHGSYAIEDFFEWMREGRIGECLSGVYSGALTMTSLEISPVNLAVSFPVCDEPVMIWNASYIGPTGSHFTEDLAADVHFTDEMINCLTTGSYRAELVIKYHEEEDRLCTYSLSSNFWLVTPETIVMPDRIEIDDISGKSFLTAPSFRITFRDEPISTLYYDLEILEGEDVAEVWFKDYGNGKDFFVETERMGEGTVTFRLSVIGEEYVPITETFTFIIEHCDHPYAAHWHNRPCTEEGWWIDMCAECGQILDEGNTAMEHLWESNFCDPATATTDGELGSIYCRYCMDALTGDQVISKAKTLFLPSGLKTIQDEAFRGCDAVQVTIPDGLESIGSKAFAYCSKLLLVVMPDSVTSIADDAFVGSFPVICCSYQNNALRDWAVAHGLPIGWWN